MGGEVDTPRWEINVHSPIIEQVISKFKFKLKYGGFFRLARNSCRQVYCLGLTKSLYIDTCSYNLNHLVQEIKKHYPSESGTALSIVFVDKHAKEQCFIELDTDESFMVMLSMYKKEKEITIYVTTEKVKYKRNSCQDQVTHESDEENETDSNCPSDSSYHSLHTSDNEYEPLNYGETHAYTAATSIDDNNGMFPVAYGVLESENTKSWTWFLKSLEKAIGTPNGLVIFSDMQKGLEAAITQVYPNVEHRECIRHLCSNFKKHFRGEFFTSKLWDAANTYSASEYDRLLNDIASVRPKAIAYLNENHKKI
ncbi:hypothetical protein LXL04_027133 [Taraxacum kok-saghyz]